MTEEFKKGLATGIAIGGVTINKAYSYYSGKIVNDIAILKGVSVNVPLTGSIVAISILKGNLIE